MNIIKAYAVKNDCYKAARKMTPKGIVVHSTGANNPNLKRYVDAPAEVGKNQYGNHWNNPASVMGRSVCVHSFIGYALNNEIKIANILPYDYCCWGVGSGSKGSYNYNPAYIQFEMCEDDHKDKAYFEGVYKTAAEYCAWLCKKFNIPVENIVSHQEAHALGYGNNHADPSNWWGKFGRTMNHFRADVKKLLSTPAQQPKPDNKASYEIGDIVEYKGTRHYTSANAATPKTCRPGKAKVTAKYNGKHPYHLVAVSGGGSNVYGWVDEADIEGAAKATPAAPATSPAKIKVKSTVRVKKGAKTYNGGGLASFVYTRNHIVKEIKGARVVMAALLWQRLKCQI